MTETWTERKGRGDGNEKETSDFLAISVEMYQGRKKEVKYVYADAQDNINHLYGCKAFNCFRFQFSMSEYKN